MKKTASPNFDNRPENTNIDILVLHYTDTKTCKEALDILKSEEKKVSSHYVVDEDGTVYKLVDEEKRAWHAGISYWRGKEKLNDFSVGIEIVNPGHLNGYRAFPEKQMQAVTKLCQEIVERNKIQPENVVAHSDIAPDRKKDPGELFDWKMLYDAGIGLWHTVETDEDRYVLLKEGDRDSEVHALQNSLHELGYKIGITGNYNKDTVHVVEAFQRHFMPMQKGKPRIVDGSWGNIEQRILEELLANIEV